MTKVYLIRHAETIGNIEDRLTGRKDYPLTLEGKRTAHELTKKLKNVKFDIAYSSTANRTTNTIQELANLDKIKIIQLEDLSEMNFGIYDGWKWKDVNKINPSIRKNQMITNEISGIKNQETTEELEERMYKCIKNICQNNDNKTILICSHGVSIEAFLRKITNTEFKDEKEKFCQHNASINKLEYSNGEFKIKILADEKYD